MKVCEGMGCGGVPFCVSGDWAMRDPESLDLVARALTKSRIWSIV